MPSQLESIIMTIVSDRQGCKISELVVEVVTKHYELYGSTPEVDLPGLIERMVRDHQLVECEYNLPNMGYRLKSFLMPAGTKANILH